MTGCDGVLRRHFIAIATGTFDFSGDYSELDVQGEVRTLREWLCDPALGDRRFDASRFESLSHEPSYDQIRREVTGRVQGRRVHSFRNADALVLYVTGHGQIQWNVHYTVLKDSDPEDLSSSALRTADLLPWLLGHRELEHVLLVVDLCEAEGLVREVTAGLLSELHFGGGQRWIVVTTTAPDTRAKLRAFTDAVRETLVELGAAAEPDKGSLEPYLDPGLFVTRVKAKLAERHQYLDALQIPSGFSCCLPNPKYDPARRDRVDTDPARQDLAVLKEDMLAHWGPRALVVPAQDGSGWAFTGRERLMARLIEFTRGRRGTLVVSGRFGSGKSAVLARLVTCSDPLFRAQHGEALAGMRFVPPQGAVDIAVLATGKTPEQIAGQIAGALEAAVPDPLPPATTRLDALTDAVAGVLEQRRRPLTLVVDALDEAVDPTGVVLSVLRRLNPAGAPRMRLLVGVRSSGGDDAPGTDHGRELADLVTEALSADRVAADAGEYWQPGDLAAYVEQILSHESSPYAAQGELAHQVASTVEAGAGRSYLLALLVATQLVDRPRPLDSDDPTLVRLVEGGLGSILDHDLSTSFPSPADRRRAGLLLSASALAFGRGIPWRETWTTVANAIAPPGEQVGDRDVEWLLRHRVGGYLVRDIEDGVTVYRPFHDALRASLTRYVDQVPADAASPGLHIGLEQAHRLTARRLFALIDSDQGPPPAYARRHLADHAAAGGVLDDKVLTTESLPYLDETRLSNLLGLTEAPPQSMLWLLLSAWRGIRHRWSWADPDANAAALDMALTALGGWIPTRHPLTAGLIWRPKWAEWSWGGTVISSEERGPASIAFGRVEGRAVLAVGADAQVTLWGAATGQAIGLPWDVPDRVRAVAMETVRDVPVAAAAVEPRTVFLWDAGTGLLRRSLTAAGDYLRTVAFGIIGDQMVVAAAGGAGRVRLWDAESGEAVREPLGSGAQIRTIALTTDPSGACRLAAGRQDGLVEQWTLTGETVHPGRTIDAGAEVNGVAWGVVEGRLVLATANSHGSAQLWDADMSRPLGPPCRHDAEIRDVALAEIDGVQYLATASFDGTAVLWNPRTGAHEPPLPHPLDVHRVAFGDVDGRIMLATASEDGITRLWDPVQPSGIRVVQRDRMRHVALVRHQGAVLLAAGAENGRAYLWTADDGRLLAAPVVPAGPDFHRWKGTQPTAVTALGVVDDRPALAVEFMGVVRMYDIAEPSRDTPVLGEYRYPIGRGYGPPRALSLDGGRALFALIGGRWDEVSLVDLRHPQAATTLPGSAHARRLAFLSGPEHQALAVVFDDRVQLYDPATTDPEGSAIRLPRVTGLLAMDTIDGTDVLAVRDDSGVQIREVATGADFASPIVTPSRPKGLAFGRVDGREVLLTAHLATVRVWNPRTGRLISELPFGTTIDSAAAVMAPDGGLLVAVGGPGIAVTELRVAYGSPAPSAFAR
ncbi:AAA family ATPase [Streptomyces sp. AMCC400023]|uniref:AAA family ATPase n=1 Tax=Streptomyces sp. AMCC400023 TaxID=2056258 RepID=UPI001F3C9CC3|nr:hypothetical protein [Streptomyces sp. AMCC400023]UJV43950.1 hypothetical protein CVT30_32640 [Streptomyces sp. AMCC400023]